MILPRLSLFQTFLVNYHGYRSLKAKVLYLNPLYMTTDFTVATKYSSCFFFLLLLLGSVVVEPVLHFLYDKENLHPSPTPAAPVFAEQPNTFFHFN